MAEQVDLPTNVRANLSDDCLVLLEEVIASNRKLAEENKKLREEHERNNKTHAEVLQRIEQRLENQNAEAGNVVRRRFHRRRQTTRIVVPAACRVSEKSTPEILILLNHEISE